MYNYKESFRSVSRRFRNFPAIFTSHSDSWSSASSLCQSWSNGTKNLAHPEPQNIERKHITKAWLRPFPCLSNKVAAWFCCCTTPSRNKLSTTFEIKNYIQILCCLHGLANLCRPWRMSWFSSCALAPDILAPVSCRASQKVLMDKVIGVTLPTPGDL